MSIRIFIDQGHNPSMVNAGAEARGLQEQEINYNVGIMLAEYLYRDPRFSVRTSRTYPEQILGYNIASSLAARVDAANYWPADYFISIHANANVNPAINGAEMYVYREYSRAYNLAERLLNSIVSYVGVRNNGIRLNQSFYVLRKTKMPAVLVELGYLTNDFDFQKLLLRQGAFAYALYLGLLEYFSLPRLY